MELFLCSPCTYARRGRQERRMLAEHTRSVCLPQRKTYSHPPPVKDALGLRTPGVYSIPCECGQVDIGQIGRSVLIRIKEHRRHTGLAQTEKSEVAEHSINQDHIIKLGIQETTSCKNRLHGPTHQGSH
jgi:hypothetical protein